jgi:hypothetical protein
LRTETLWTERNQHDVGASRALGDKECQIRERFISLTAKQMVRRNCVRWSVPRPSTIASSGSHNWVVGSMRSFPIIDTGCVAVPDATWAPYDKHDFLASGFIVQAG